MNLENKVRKYIDNVKETFKEIKVKHMDKKVMNILTNVKAYIMDAEYYLNTGKYDVALSCIAYAEGLLDALRILEILDFKWKYAKNMPVAVTAGTFEILHPGHIYLLKEASKYGKLYVIIARDKNVLKFKGRIPLISEEQRRIVVDAVKYVYKAILGDEQDILRKIEEIKPDYIVLGPDQNVDEEWLKRELKRRGLECKVVRIKEKFNVEGMLTSTSKIINKIRSTKE